jgi:hypothetical protein
MNKIHFIPNTNPHSEFSHFEVSPKRQDSESNAENIREVWTDLEHPEFWGVYGRLFEKDGEAVHILDRQTEAGALDFVRMLNGYPHED